MILGLGIDLCEISRIAGAIGRPRFLERVCTPAERQRIEAAPEKRRAEIAAGLFAAKEAVAKALGTGFSGFGPWDIEILPDAAGMPGCRLWNGAAVRAKALCGGAEARAFVSITHESGMAAATAVLERIGPIPAREEEISPDGV